MKMFELRNSKPMERFVVELFVSNIYTINTCVEFDTFLGRYFFFKGEVNKQLVQESSYIFIGTFYKGMKETPGYTRSPHDSYNLPPTTDNLQYRKRTRSQGLRPLLDDG